MSTEKKAIPIPQIFAFSTGLIVTAFVVGLYSYLNKPLTTERVLKHYDTNQNGVLEREEFGKLNHFFDSDLSKLFEQYDLDKTRDINEQELSNLLEDYNSKY